MKPFPSLSYFFPQFIYISFKKKFLFLYFFFNHYEFTKITRKKEAKNAQEEENKNNDDKSRLEKQLFLIIKVKSFIIKTIEKNRFI